MHRHLNFRDYLIAHPEEAQAYGRLKDDLARRFPEDIDSYIDGKSEFIREIDAKANAWAEGTHRD
ncbi:MAG: GrpB family protein [Anaerolineae bacterium]|nr:GrpB family protein [Anaerolineae bacterium]